MSAFDARQWARTIREHRNPLVVAGDGCERISLKGVPLLQYAVGLARSLGAPLAATGNTLPAVRALDGGVKAKKMWLAELQRFLEDEWEEPLLQERPDLLVTIGYRPELLRGLAAGVREIHVAHLGPGRLPPALLSMDEVTLAEWQRNLEALLGELKTKCE